MAGLFLLNRLSIGSIPLPSDRGQAHHERMACASCGWPVRRMGILLSISLFKQELTSVLQKKISIRLSDASTTILATDWSDFYYTSICG